MAFPFPLSLSRSCPQNSILETKSESITTRPTITVTIADNAFKNCNELEEVSLPDTIETIGVNAFQNDQKITGLKLPKNIKTMGYGAFGECTGLTEI